MKAAVLSSLHGSWGLPPPPQQLTLGGDEVHVWCFSLEPHYSTQRALLEFLTPDERERADRFRVEKARRHFIVARGTLRTILTSYLKVGPEKLRFGYSSFGKPYLLNQAGEDELRFNLSHSHELAICAVSRARSLGIDIEYLHVDFDYLQLASHFFSPGEATTLGALPVESQARGFFNCWTRKEAYIKAHGAGLSLPLDQFEVSLAPGEPASLLSSAHDPQEVMRWTLRELSPAPDYIAALAVEGNGNWKLRCWRWPR